MRRTPACSCKRFGISLVVKRRASLLEVSIRLLLLVVAVIHLLPLIGFLGADQLARLYAIHVSDPNLELLMRHRAILFGILGAVFVLAAIRPSYRVLAFSAASVSIGSFLYLCWSADSINDALRGVQIVDLVAGVGLVAAIVLDVIRRRSAPGTA